MDSLKKLVVVVPTGLGLMPNESETDVDLLPIVSSWRAVQLLLKDHQV